MTGAGEGSRPLILFGGTFDPVHEAHLRVARAASAALGNAPVHLLPNAVPPHRPQPGASGEHRRAMLAAAVANDPELIVDDRELQRSGPSFTLDTLREFRAEAGDRPLVFLLGADSYAQLDQWRDWQHYPELCHLAVAPRPGAEEPPPAVTAAFAVTREPETLMTRPAGHALLLDGPELDLSATALRAALRAGEIPPGVPPAVADYIRRHGLYRRSSHE